MNYAVVNFPTVFLSNINVIRERYDPTWNIIQPHITLVSPFSNLSEYQVIEHLDLVTRTEKAFQIHLNGLTNSFDDYLFLLVKEGKQEVVKLHDKLYSGILALYLRNDLSFVPHLTLGHFRSKDNTFDKDLYEKAYAEVNNMNIDMTYVLNSISLIQGDGQSPSSIVRSFNLIK